MSPAGVLGQILDETRARLRSDPVDEALLEAQARARPPGPNAMASLIQPGVRIIAEVKRSSPSAGDILRSADPMGIAQTYQRAGAAAISVLTEPKHFGGSLADLRAVTGSCDLPALRKDFIVSRRQIAEARLAGASMVLLIVAGLTDAELEARIADAMDLGLQPLVETHTAEEVQRALGAGATLIGINSRDLISLRVDLAVAESLRSLIPDDVIAVAESGIAGPTDITRLRSAGFDVFLIGSALMEARDPGAALARMLEAS